MPAVRLTLFFEPAQIYRHARSLSLSLSAPIEALSTSAAARSALGAFFRLQTRAAISCVGALSLSRRRRRSREPARLRAFCSPRADELCDTRGLETIWRWPTRAFLRRAFESAPRSPCSSARCSSRKSSRPRRAGRSAASENRCLSPTNLLGGSGMRLDSSWVKTSGPNHGNEIRFF